MAAKKKKASTKKKPVAKKKPRVRKESTAKKKAAGKKTGRKKTGRKKTGGKGVKKKREGISLHIGINFLDPNGYRLAPPDDPPDPDWPDGWDGPLKACEADATDMCEIAKSQGFKATLLTTENATAERVTAEIRNAAKKLAAGDAFFISFAGHGGQLPDHNKDEKAERPGDYEDETWCLFDRQFLDDELNDLYAEFDPGVRIIIVSDSCHSGTASRSVASSALLTPAENKKLYGLERPAVRSMPTRGGAAGKMYRARKPLYDKIQANVKNAKPKASVLLLSACQDNQEASDGVFNGKFTAALKDVWGDGFTGSYVEFHAAIKAVLQTEMDFVLKDRAAGGSSALPVPQDPNFYATGVKSEDFMAERPFSIDGK